MRDEKFNEIQMLVAQGETIQAIKLYRELTGAGLKEAKDFIERVESPSEGAQLSNQEFRKQVASHLAKGEAIHAIKLYRTHYGSDLKEARMQVEALAIELGLPFKTGIGCAGSILLTASVGTALYHAIGF